MSALAEALLAAQRQALATLERQYVAGTIEVQPFCEWLDAMGCRDAIEQGQLLASLNALKEFGVAPAASGAPPKSPETEPATDAQMKLVAKLCDEKQQVAPNAPLTKAQAHRVIDELKAGTYDADKWFPF